MPVSSRIETQINTLSSLYRISRLALTGSNMHDMIAEVHEILRELMHAENFYIALQNPSGKGFSFPYFIDEMDGSPPEPVMGKGLTQYVLRTGAPLLASPELYRELQAQGKVDQIGAIPVDWLGVPLVIQHQPIGVLVVQSYSEAHRFSNADLDLIGFVSDHFSAAIERQRVAAKLRHNEALFRDLAKSAPNVIADSATAALTGSEMGLFDETNKYELVDANLRSIVQYAPYGILIVKGAGDIIFVNQTLEQLFGYSERELLGSCVDMLVPDHFKEQHAAHVTQFNATPKTRAMGGHRILLCRHRSGKEFPAEISLTPLGNLSDSMTLATVVDASERVKAQALKDDFVSSVSHELRTPLTSISGALSLVDSEAIVHLPRQAKQLVMIAYDNSKRLGRIVDDILDIQKIESGMMVFNIESLEAKEQIELAAAAICGFADAYNISLVINAPDSQTLFQADRMRLGQVFANLLSNAIKFSPKGGTVWLGAFQRDEMVRISVADAGPGIAPEFQSRVFEKFGQAASPQKRGRGGTGLGLSITKALVENMGGSIDFTTVVDEGTVFYFDLPAQQHVDADH